MEVNRELPNLATGLDESVHLLEPEGRMVVLAYHSLEDRMVKERFADWSRTEEPGYVPDGLPRADAQPAHPPPDPAAAPRRRTPRSQANPRAASARLRAVERLR